jgi:hypothetical protein
LPNSNASPGGIDFITALGRLLKDGALRDAFAVDATAVARQMNLAAGELAAFVQLMPAELETQAVVLLRKRFDLVRRGLPRTCRALGREAWAIFQGYARTSWPKLERAAADDARGFCEALLCLRPEALCRVEYHRVRFLCSDRRWEVRLLDAVPFRRGFRPGLHIFLRRGVNRWHEWLLYAGV